MPYPINLDDLAKDVYFSREWLELDLKGKPFDNEEPFEFRFEENGNWFIDQGIKAGIDKVGGVRVHKRLYDIETPYGFSGPLTNTQDPDFLRRAFKEYEEKAREEGIIAEFIRFHPFNPFPEGYSDHLDFCLHERNVVQVPFDGGMEQIFSNFRSSLRRNIRKALKQELRFDVSDHREEDRESFKELYWETMRRIEAPSDYFFNEAYFEALFEAPFAQLFLIRHQGRAVNGLLLLKSGKQLYYHLGGTDPEYYSWNVNPLNFYYCMEWGIDKGYQGLCLGGGNSKDPEDPLFKFKRKFSPHVWPFYIGGKVFDRSNYDALIEMRESAQGIAPAPERFLKYRF